MKPGSRSWLGVLLALVDAAAWLAPASRRREWRRQWRGDVWHEWLDLTRRPHGRADRARLTLRTAGALRHAIWLRANERTLDMITHDLRYGWRLLVRRPAFTVVAVLTLGLGIGANVTIYSWIESLMRRPLPAVGHLDRLMILAGTTATRNDLSFSYPDAADFRAQRPASVDDVIAYNYSAMNLRIDGRSERVWGQIVTGNYFDCLGIRPALGRAFLPEEDRTPDTHPVVVFSDAFWRRRFASDPSVIGRSIILNGRTFSVIGVAPAGFRGNEPALAFDVWVPMMMQAAVIPGDRLTARRNGWLQVMVKLHEGASLERAQADLDVISGRLAAASPEVTRRGARVYPTWRAPGWAGSTMTPVLTVLMGVVGMVLLIACANVANLLLARAASRQRETAVRLAIGASRGRLVQQLLTESTLLAAAGGLAGAAIAYWTTDVIRIFIPPTPFPVAIDPSLSAPVLVFAVVITAASAMIFGLIPALQGSTSAVISALKESAGAVTSPPARARLRQALVIGQVALSLILLVSAGLFLRTLRNAQALDPGFSTRNGILAQVEVMSAGYDTPRGRRFFSNLQARVREVPGVEAATVAFRVPLGFGGSSDFTVGIEGYTPAPNEEVTLYYNRVGSDYLRTMGIGLISGRDFTERDDAAAMDVGIVNETTARRYFGGRNPIGRRIKSGDRTIQVVGVVRDGKYTRITETPRPYLYLPVQQWYRPDTVLTVKTSGDPLAIIPSVQQVVRELDPTVAVLDVRTIAEHLGVAVFVQRQIASLLGVFGGLALLLATVGLYGVVATTVSQRTAEIGMRLALGASRRDIMVLVFRQAFVLTLAGVAIGLAGALVVTRAFRTLLVGVSPTDGVSFAAMTALLLLVAAAATYLPARHAASVDPLRALRQD